MNRHIKHFACACAIIILAGCAGPAKRNADLYGQAVKAHVQIAQADAQAEMARATAREADRTAAMAACKTDACVQSAIMASALGQAIEALGAANRATAAVPAAPYERDTAAKFATAFSAVSPLLGQGVQAWAGDRAGERQAQVQISQDQLFGGIVTGALTANRDIAAAAVANASPVYNVGGDMIGGDRTETNIGDGFTGGDRSETNVGGDQVGGDQHIGDTVGGDQVGRDQVDNSGIIGDGNRQYSDGPIDNSDDGDDCTDSDCSQPPPDNGGGAP